MTVDKPNPGSYEAMVLGCKCPVLDNGRGRGCGRVIDGRPVFWINGKCPVHNWTEVDIQLRGDTGAPR